MSALFRVSIGAVAVGLCCLPLGAARAQQTTNRNPGEIKPAQAQSDAANPTGQSGRATSSQIDRSQPGRTSQGRQPYTANYRGAQASGQNSGVENYLANCLLKKNQGEIELGKFASQQSQNPQVKEFAQQVVKDHQQVVEKLQQVAGAGGSTTRTSSTSLDTSARSETDRPARERTRTPASSATDTTQSGAEARTNRIASDRDTSESVTSTSRTSAQGSGALQQLASIEEKIAERCQQALREELQQKSGAEFDECFVGSQIAGHMQMLAALEVISQEDQGQLKQIAEEAKPTVQKHLEHAKQLAKQLKSGEQGSAQAQRTSPSNRTERQ